MPKSRTSKRMIDKPVANSLAVIRSAIHKTAAQPSKGSTAVLDDQQRQHLSTVLPATPAEDLQRQVHQYRDRLRVSTARQIDMLSRQLKDALFQTKDPDKIDQIVRLIDDTYTRFSGLL